MPKKRSRRKPYARPYQRYDDVKDRCIDANGCLVEVTAPFGDAGPEVHMRYDDIPESDITLVDGMRCTSPVRTLIDMAAQVTEPELMDIYQQFLDLGHFTPGDVWARLSEPDMAERRGAQILRDVLPR